MRHAARARSLCHGPAHLESAGLLPASCPRRNVPNPFNPTTTLRFDLSMADGVRLEVYDVAGRLVRTLVNADLPAGTHSAVWDGKDVRGAGAASGSYVARLSAGGKTASIRMLHVR